MDVKIKDIEQWLLTFSPRINPGGLRHFSLRCAKAGYLDGVISALKTGADVNARDKDSVTVLICAARNGHAEIVNRLVQTG